MMIVTSFPHVNRWRVVSSPRVDRWRVVFPHINKWRIVSPCIDRWRVVFPRVNRWCIVSPRVNRWRVVSPCVDRWCVVFNLRGMTGDALRVVYPSLCGKTGDVSCVVYPSLCGPRVVFSSARLVHKSMQTAFSIELIFCNHENDKFVLPQLWKGIGWQEKLQGLHTYMCLYDNSRADVCQGLLPFALGWKPCAQWSRRCLSPRSTQASSRRSSTRSKCWDDCNDIGAHNRRAWTPVVRQARTRSLPSGIRRSSQSSPSRDQRWHAKKVSVPAECKSTRR